MVSEDTESQERTMDKKVVPTPREFYDGMTSWPHREPTFVAAVVAVLVLLAIVALSMI
jgi:hypothetical protein